MSAANRGRKRVKHDAYYTPAWPVRRLLEAVDLPGGHWLEPSVGDGAIIRTVNTIRQDIVWHGVDVRPVHPVAKHHHHADFFKWKPDRKHYDVIIGNPPYKFAWDFVKRSLELSPNVILLLRVGFMESDKRADWMREHTPSVNLLPNRPSFRWRGSDSTTYAWLQWGGLSWSDNACPTVRILKKTSRAERLRDRDDAQTYAKELKRKAAA